MGKNETMGFEHLTILQIRYLTELEQMEKGRGTIGAIAEKLNMRHVQSPKEYKIANGENYNAGFQGTDTPKWSAVQIKRILTNEVRR